MPPWKLTIIIVNYNSSLVLTDCLKSLTRQSTSDFLIRIVDNSPREEEFSRLKRLKHQVPALSVELFKPKYNLGFAGGNNVGLKNLNTQYVLLLNPDTELDQDCLERAISFLEAHPKTGFLCPKIVYHDDPATIWYAGGFFKPLDRRFLFQIGQYQADTGQYDQIRKTDYACGCALFCRASLLDEIGLLDELYFCYAEEVDWNIRAEKMGYQNVYFAPGVVYHKYPLEERLVPFTEYLTTRNQMIMTFKNLGPREILFYVLLLNPKRVFLLSLRFLKRGFQEFLAFFRSQVRATIMGFLLGLKRRHHRACGKEMAREWIYLQHWTDKSNSGFVNQKLRSP